MLPLEAVSHSCRHYRGEGLHPGRLRAARGQREPGEPDPGEAGGDELQVAAWNIDV